MKPLRGLALVLGLSMGLTAGMLADPGPAAARGLPSANVAWQPAGTDADVDRAFAQARAAGKPVLLYWGATWCPPCNQLKATLFNRQDFAEASKGFVAVHVDGDLRGAQKLGTRFKVSGYPTVVLFKPDGTEITRLPGEVEPDRMMAVLRLGMAGGRPVKDVLADARAQRPLSAGEWRMLAFYPWYADEQQLIPEAEQPDLIAGLANTAARPGSQADTDTRTRLWLQAVAASDDGKGLKADAAMRQRMMTLLADPAAVMRHADIVAGAPVDLLRALTEEDTPERAAMRNSLSQALATLEGSGQLSRGDRVSALIGRIDLARIGQPRDAVKVDVPDALRQEVRRHVQRDDQEITDGYERQAVVTAGAYALARVGLWKDSDDLLKANLSRSHSPYYLMSQLGGNARRQGDIPAALGWYGQAFEKSEGPATRLQWGSGYLSALVEMAPKDAARIEQVADTLFREAAADPGAFAGRSVRSLQRVGKRLRSWSADGQHAATMARLQKSLDTLCRQVDPAEGQRATCQGLLKADA